jgi:hypothetical protein
MHASFRQFLFLEKLLLGMLIRVGVVCLPEAKGLVFGTRGADWFPSLNIQVTDKQDLEWTSREEGG